MSDVKNIVENINKTTKIISKIENIIIELGSEIKKIMILFLKNYCLNMIWNIKLLQ